MLPELQPALHILLSEKHGSVSFLQITAIINSKIAPFVITAGTVLYLQHKRSHIQPRCTAWTTVKGVIAFAV